MNKGKYKLKRIIQGVVYFQVESMALLDLFFLKTIE